MVGGVSESSLHKDRASAQSSTAQRGPNSALSKVHTVAEVPGLLALVIDESVDTSNLLIELMM